MVHEKKMISNNIHIFEYKIEEIHRKQLYDEVINLHNNYEYPKIHNNMPINGSFVQEIKSFFIDKCMHLYGKFTILEDSRDAGWAYITNKDWYKEQLIHNHIQTSTYVGVYYLNVPQFENKYDGCLKFYDFEKAEPIDYFFPKNNQFIIFESDLIHSISQPKTEEYRISINLELKVRKKINFNHH
jgi:hypothetical protein